MPDAARAALAQISGPFTGMPNLSRWMRVRKSVGLVGALLATSLLLVLADVIFGPTLATAVLSLVTFVLLAVMLFRFEPVFFVLVFLFVLGQFGAMLSGVLIESGVYVSEQRRYGFVTGSTVWLGFYTTFFLSAAFFLFQYFDAPKRAQELFGRFRVWRGTRLTIYLLLIAVLVLVFVGLMVNGSPLLEQRDRFSYWRSNSIPFLQPIHNQLSTLIFAMGLAFPFAQGRTERAGAILLLATTLLYFVLQGEKYTALIQVLYSFALPFLMRTFATQVHKPSVKRALLIGLAIGGALTSLILYQYYSTHQAANPLANLSQRIALQGHVWWGAFEQRSAGTLPVPPREQIEKEARSLLTLRSAGTVPDTGMTYLMRVVAPLDLVERYRAQGIRFTMGYPAIGLVTLGPWGLLALQLVAASLLVIVILFLLKGVRQANVLLAIVGYKLLNELNGVFGMGNLNELFSLKTILYAGLVLAIVSASRSHESLAAAAKASRLRTRKA